MIALDANVLVRYLVRDDETQARKAKALVDRLDKNDERAHVSEIVLCELVWVLRTVYGFGRAPIAQALKQLAASRQLLFDCPDAVQRAIAAYETSKGDFADYMIREHARAAGCDAVMTFDRALLKEDAFEVVG